METLPQQTNMNWDEEDNHSEIEKLLLVKYREKFGDLLNNRQDLDFFLTSTLKLINKNPKLQECTIRSLFDSCKNIAEIGLEFTEHRGLAYIVPYYNKETKTYIAHSIVGYRGFIELATRGDRITNMESHLVFNDDKFSIELGTNPSIMHQPNWASDNAFREVVGCYAVAYFTNSRYQYEYMNKKELDDIKRTAKSQSFWGNHEGEMQRKTVIRRLAKYLPYAPFELHKAIEMDNAMYVDAESPKFEQKALLKRLDEQQIDPQVIEENRTKNNPIND